ncbi:MAG: hypothetical protein SGPRY_006826 [Prymnesium sp.]
MQAKFHHQHRPERKKQAHTEKVIREEAKELAEAEIRKLQSSGGDANDAAARRAIVKKLYSFLLGKARSIFDRSEFSSDKPWRIREEEEGRLAVAKELARKVAEEEVARAAGDDANFLLPSEHYSSVWEEERKTLARAKDSPDEASDQAGYELEAGCELTLEESDVAGGAGEIQLEKLPLSSTLTSESPKVESSDGAAFLDERDAATLEQRENRARLAGMRLDDCDELDHDEPVVLEENGSVSTYEPPTPGILV